MAYPDFSLSYNMGLGDILAKKQQGKKESSAVLPGC